MPSNKFVWEEGDIEVIDTGDMRLLDDKWRFIHSQIEASSIIASLQRANVYVANVPDEHRGQLRSVLGSELQRIGVQYGNPVMEPNHVRNIEELALQISERCRPALIDGRFRIGVAQKSLNLYLKYLWCLRRIPTPPHCPFDNRIIARIPGNENVRWTKLDKIPNYEHLVAAAKRAARGKSLAQWELAEYNPVSSGA